MQTRSVHTIADVARLASVSKSTVSRALDDSPLIAAETKERIRSIAREHGFHRNAAARRLSLQQSHAIALVTHAYEPDPALPDVFMLEILSGISSALHAADYDLIVLAPGEGDWARRYLESGRADGFILLPAMCRPALIEMLVEMGAPFITWGLAPETAEYCSVSGDSVTGGRIATEHLLGSGRRRVAFLGGPAGAPEVRDRYRGYEAALHDAGLDVDQALVTHASWMTPAESGAAAAHELFDRAPDVDAIFANSDLLAIAAMDAVRSKGRCVPDDVAVVGYDDVSLARYANPPLTTIRQNGPLAGRLLAENLLQHLQTGVVTNVKIPAEVVVRESA